jgi:WD40 repeat protein
MRSIGRCDETNASAHAIALSPDGKHVAFGCRDGTVRVSNPQRPLPALILGRGYDETDPITAVAFSPRGHLLAAGAADGSVRVWTGKGGVIGETLDAESSISALAFSSDDQKLETVGRRVCPRRSQPDQRRMAQLLRCSALPEDM